MKERIPTISINEGARTFTMTPIENHLHLQAMVSIRLRNRHLGAYLLKKSKSSPWQLVFGFTCQGIHSFLSAEEIDGVFDQVEAGLKDFPQSESVTFHLGAFKTDRDRQASLASLTKRAPTDEVKFLLMGERQRVQELAASGLREPKLLKVYRSLAKVIKIYIFLGNEVRNCRYQQSNSISDQIAVCDFCILMKVSEIF